MIASIVTQAGQSLGGFLPRLGGALALLVLGLLVARLAARAMRKGLGRTSLDDLAERWKVNEMLGRVGLQPSLTRVLASATRVGLSLVVVFAALSLLGLQFLSASLNAAVLFLPKLLIALALVLAGLVLARLARERVDRTAYQMDLPVPLGLLAEVTVVAVFALTAATQLAIPTLIITLLVAIAAAGLMAMLALAFGLGGRGMARALSAGRYVRGAHSVGQRISIGGVGGRIRAIEPAVTVVETAAGETVRIPNHMLLETVVTIHAEPPPPDG